MSGKRRERKDIPSGLARQSSSRENFDVGMGTKQSSILSFGSVASVEIPIPGMDLDLDVPKSHGLLGQWFTVFHDENEDVLPDNDLLSIFEAEKKITAMKKRQAGEKVMKEVLAYPIPGLEFDFWGILPPAVVEIEESNELEGFITSTGIEDVPEEVEDEDAPATGPYEYAMVFKNVENKDGTVKQSDMATACYHALTDAGNFQYYL